MASFEVLEHLFEPVEFLQSIRRVLAPGGILFLGKVETLLGPVRQRFAVVDQRERVFRRL